MKRSGCWVAVMAAGLALSGCDPYEEPAVRALPPLERASPEARLGLPEVEGEWRFVGWEVPTAEAVNGLARPGELWIATQRLDSIAGFYLAGGERLPVVGEVRRDSVIALAALGGDQAGRFLAGRVARDTLWLELTSFAFFASWPRGTRGAFVRQPVNLPFVRLPDGTLLRDTMPEAAAPDTAAEAEATSPEPRPTGPPLLGEPVTPPADTPAPTPPAPRQPQPAPRDTVSPRPPGSPT